AACGWADIDTPSDFSAKSRDCGYNDGPTYRGRIRPAGRNVSGCTVMAGTKFKGRARPKLSPRHKPEHLTLEEWQRELRRQFGREQRFRITNRGDHSVFSEFDVGNPQSGRTYRVTIRGPRPGDNACTCPDFATNTLGTCKHVEFTLARLERRRRTAGI